MKIVYQSFTKEIRLHSKKYYFKFLRAPKVKIGKDRRGDIVRIGKNEYHPKVTFIYPFEIRYYKKKRIRGDKNGIKNK